MKTRNKTVLLVFFLLSSRWLGTQESAGTSFVPEQWTYHLQATFFPMYHGSFPALYSGPKSLSPGPETDASFTSTVFLGGRLWHDGALYVDFEGAAGSGFSDVTGIAGFPNGEIYRVSDPSLKIIVNRLYFRQVFGLGGEQETVKDDQNQLAEKIDISRLTLVAGKFSLTDFFNQNTYNGDPRGQFSNWAMWFDGAWDYPADLQGYDWGIFLEYNQKDWAFRLSSLLENAVPNSSDMDLNIAQAHGDSAEFEYNKVPMFNRSNPPSGANP